MMEQPKKNDFISATRSCFKAGRDIGVRVTSLRAVGEAIKNLLYQTPPHTEGVDRSVENEPHHKTIIAYGRYATNIESLHQQSHTFGMEKMGGGYAISGKRLTLLGKHYGIINY